ncbi:MAG: hypothetical protein J6S67_01155 [Methanobrevibacter sp.]|nr:hypothetical protein [Methanobrevibacter sp.]
MKHNDFLSWIGTVFGTICTALQTEQVLQYVSLALTILSTGVAIAFTVWKWWKNASADGKITKDEVDNLIDDVKDVVDNKKKGEDKDD